MKKIIVAVLVVVTCSCLYGCSGETTEKQYENNQEQSDNVDKNENKIEKKETTVKDGVYEVEVVELTENDIKVNIIFEIVTKKLNDDGKAEEVIEARGVPGDDKNAETVTLSKKLKGKEKIRNRSIVRMKVEGGEVVELVEL